MCVCVCSTHHGLNDDREVFSFRVIESDIAASSTQVACSRAMLQIVVPYLTELGGVGCECVSVCVCVCVCECVSVCV